MALDTPNSANTLSLRFKPGEEKRVAPSNSNAIFTFGDFTLERSFEPDILTADTKSLRFDNFSTLESLNATNFDSGNSVFVQSRELKQKLSEATSHAYFGSFYTEVANSINRIIDEFPYAILSYDYGSGTTVYDYSRTVNLTTGARTSTFKIPFSALTNQGSIILNSGSTFLGDISLVNNSSDFAIQISGVTSANTAIYAINDYSFSAGTYLQFTINGHLLTGTTATASTLPIYIRPTEKRLANYKRNISALEYQILYGEEFSVPNVETEVFSGKTFHWPRTIDGFSPDNSGDDFDTYKDDILNNAALIDEIKTNILLRTAVGDNFIELDSENQVFTKTVQSYAHQFDHIKRYIDSIAYAHSLNPDGTESVPNKFLAKLSNLLGLKLSNSFSEMDLFELLAGDTSDSSRNSKSYFNIEIWRRVLTNINWLYKKKGTRDALMFLFRLVGAPDDLIVFDEFVYDISKTFQANLSTGSTIAQNSFLNKVNENGFINYDVSQFAFQEGGQGRGDGVNFIKQWEPEFAPIKRVDNIKIVTGNTLFNGSQNIINSKEVCIGISGAQAIEKSAFNFYHLSGSTWKWGSTATTFSAQSVPYFYVVETPDFVAPDSITAMTFNEWIEFVYKSNIPPTNRKTNNQGHTMFHYPELRKIYLNYYLLINPLSNQLNMKKLEEFIDLIERQIQTYLIQFIPATTIFNCGGGDSGIATGIDSNGSNNGAGAIIYKNVTFNRQRFVYKEGINAGSEFRARLPESLSPPASVEPINITSKINDLIEMHFNPVTINSGLGDQLSNRLTGFKVISKINEGVFTSTIEGFTVESELNDSVTTSITVE